MSNSTESSHVHASKDCKSCHHAITDGQAYKLGSDQWHVSCFKCSKCSKALGVNSNFLVLGTGSLVCSDCSYTCKSCSKKIYDLAILTGDLAYCADCFKCKACNKPIEDLKYARTSKGLFCIPCHNVLMEKKKKYEKLKKLRASKDQNKLHSNSIQASETDRYKNSNKMEKDSKNEASRKILETSTSPKAVDASKDSVPSHLSPPPSGISSSSQRSLNTNNSFNQPIQPYSSNNNSSSMSTFDVDDYGSESGDNQMKPDGGSSVYSKENLEPYTDNNLKKVDSFPIEKFDVIMDFDFNHAKKEDRNNSQTIDSPNTITGPLDIPTLKSDLGNGFSNYMNSHNKDSDLSIPIRSPKRSNLSPSAHIVSPVQTTTQFRTPELATPRKKNVPVEIIDSPANRRGCVIDNNEHEKEPESFINFDDETEEESIVSISDNARGQNPATTPNLNKNTTGLMSPMRPVYNTSNTSDQLTGLNISGLDPKSNSGNQDYTSGSAQTEIVMSTPEQIQQNFDPNMTPNTRRKQKASGTLGRSLTKVFGRKKPDAKDQLNDQSSTNETITSNNISPNVNYTPQRHARTKSDHSFTSFSTPPVPASASSNAHSRSRSDHSFNAAFSIISSHHKTSPKHTRSISASSNMDHLHHFPDADRELKSIKSEINSLTLSKVSLMKDIQSLKSQLKVLESEVNEKQRMSRDLDVILQNKRKISVSTANTLNTNDDLSFSSSKLSSKDELKLSSNEDLLSNESQQQQPLPPIPASQNHPSATSNLMYNPYNQQNLSNASQMKDKRGFMRRLFGTHSALNSASSNQSSSVSNANGSLGTVNISQPMNLRMNEDEESNVQSTSLNQSSSFSSTLKSDIPPTTGMKPSRSTNFLQWRNNNNIDSKHLYTMSLQELCDYEGSTTIPFIIKTCLTEVEKRGSKIEGIYRISASASLVEKIESFFESLDINNSNELSKMYALIDCDIHALAGLLKRYLKKMPDSLIPQNYYSAYVNLSRIDGDENFKLQKLAELIAVLPDANKSTLYLLSKHLALISENEKWTKMNSSSLATVFAPTLVRHNSLHPQQEIQDNKAKTEVTELVFKHYQTIFKGIE